MQNSTICKPHSVWMIWMTVFRLFICASATFLTLPWYIKDFLYMKSIQSIFQTRQVTADTNIRVKFFIFGLREESSAEMPRSITIATYYYETDYQCHRCRTTFVAINKSRDQIRPCPCCCAINAPQRQVIWVFSFFDPSSNIDSNSPNFFINSTNRIKRWAD